MNIVTQIKNDASTTPIRDLPEGTSAENNVLTLLYTADCTNSFPFGSLPPLFFVTAGGKNDKVLVTEINGKSTRQLSNLRNVSTLKATLDLGEYTTTLLSNTKVGDCFRHRDEVYLITDRPEKAKDKCIWAVPLSGRAGQTFENDWTMKSTYRDVSIQIVAKLT